MGDTFFIKQAVFCGHAVEHSICCWGATTPDGDVAPERKVAAILVPCFRREPQDGIQMAAAFSERRAAGIARSLSPARADAAPVERTEYPTDTVLAREAPGLGTQEAASAVAAGRAPGTESANDSSVAQTIELRGRTAPASAQSLCVPVSGADSGSTPQSGLDSGFQRLVSHRERRTVRTVDRAGSVQPLRAGSEAACDPTLAASSTSVYKAFSGVWEAGDYSRGQWEPLRIERPGGAFATECLVDATGHTSGVHAARPSSGQRSPRTISSGNETRNDTPGCLESAGATTSDYELAQALQSKPTPRSAGTEKTARVLSQKSAAFSQKPSRVVLSAWRSGAAGSQQRRDSLGRAQTFCGRSFRRANGSPQAIAPGSLVGLFFQTPDRPSSSTRRRSDAASSLQTSTGRSSKTKSVTYVLASKCHPCVGTVPSPALSSISWRRGRRHRVV